MNKKNQGYTLVELIVVIAVIAVFVSVIAASINYISNTNTKKTKNIIMNALSGTKTAAMAKSSGGTISFSSDGSYYYYQIGTQEKEKICSKRVKLSIDSAGGKIDLAGTTLEFNKADGSLKTGGDVTIYITGGTNYTIKIYKETGKAELQ